MQVKTLTQRNGNTDQAYTLCVFVSPWLEIFSTTEAQSSWSRMISQCVLHLFDNSSVGTRCKHASEVKFFVILINNYCVCKKRSVIRLYFNYRIARKGRGFIIIII